MLTLEQFRRSMEAGRKVRCTSDEERNNVIHLLLEMGYRHGNSNVSRECLDGRHTGWWWAPFISGGGIEFYPSGYRDDIQYKSIVHLMHPIAVIQVDDLL